MQWLAAAYFVIGLLCLTAGVFMAHSDEEALPFGVALALFFAWPLVLCRAFMALEVVEVDETTQAVAEFHEAFGIENAEQPKIPDLPDGYRRRCLAIAGVMEAIANGCHDEATSAKQIPANTTFLRLQLIQSELAELALALAQGDRVGALDALSDIQYVLDGTYLALGLQDLKVAAFREVHRSNMTKLGPDGKPVHDKAGRVVKGPDYEPPNLRALFD